MKLRDGQMEVQPRMTLFVKKNPGIMMVNSKRRILCIMMMDMTSMDMMKIGKKMRLVDGIKILNAIGTMTGMAVIGGEFYFVGILARWFPGVFSSGIFAWDLDWDCFGHSKCFPGFWPRDGAKRD